ncbi:hypothetical protein ACUR5C_13945 [Aliikangiella sp. IMCC44653]
MKKIIVVLGIAVGIFNTGFLVAAETPLLDKRQKAQKLRILDGVESGELTRREARKAARGQVKLQRMENKAKQDGVVTARERARLQHKANKESAKIAINKHDRQKRLKARKNKD